MENEIEQIMKGNLKIMAFPEFPYSELKPILDFIESRGYKIDFIDNGNIICQKEIKNGQEEYDKI
ncbi:MAG: hypothetical protein IMZ60_03830 [Actinobacteria bacterium]|nr:hypothetical protein [Actinomycetota bacterium]